MSRIEVHLFGEFQARQGDKPLQFRDRRTRVLFAYLVTRPKKSVSRSELLRVFWGDLPGSVARNRLYVYLNYIRNALGNGLQRKRNTVALNEKIYFWVDTEAFERLVDQVDELDEEDTERERLLKKAFALYRRGDFLAGVEDQWCLEKQLCLRDRFVHALKAMTVFYRAQKAYAAAVASAREWVKATPFSEQAYRELILALWAGGDATQALQSYEECREILDTELKEAPSWPMQALYQELKGLVKGQADSLSGKDYKRRFHCERLLIRAKQYEYEGRREEQGIVLDEAYHITQTLEDPFLMAAVENERARLYWRVGHFEKGQLAALEALKLNEEVGNKLGQTESFSHLGFCCYYQGDFQGALERFEQAHRLAQNLDKRTFAKTHRALGMAYMGLGQPQKAVELFQASVELLQRLANKHEQANALSNLGAAYHTLGELGKALKCYQEAFALQKDASHPWGMAANLHNIAVIHDDLGEYKKAELNFKQAYETFIKLNDDHSRVSVLVSLTAVFNHLTHYDKALESSKDCLALARKIGDQQGEAGVLVNRGFSYLEMQRWEESQEALTRALELSRAAGLKELEIRALSHLANLRLVLNNPQQALQFSQQAIELLANLELINEESFWLTHYEACRALGQAKKAQKALQRAHHLVQAKIQAIQDEPSRNSFLRNVPHVRTILKLWQQHEF